MTAETEFGTVSGVKLRQGQFTSNIAYAPTKLSPHAPYLGVTTVGASDVNKN